MSAYVSAPNLAWILEFENDDVRDVGPMFRDLMKAGDVVTMKVPGDPNETPMHVLVNFGLLMTLFVSSDRPSDDERKGKVTLPTSLGAIEQD